MSGAQPGPRASPQPAPVLVGGARHLMSTNPMDQLQELQPEDDSMINYDLLETNQ